MCRSRRGGLRRPAIGLLRVWLLRVWLLGVWLLGVWLLRLSGDIVPAVGTELGTDGHRGLALGAHASPVVHVHWRRRRQDW